jgi:hypothetical protein
MPADIQYQAADDILTALGINATAINVNLLVAWMENEYTADELAVTNNPMATSISSPGQVGYCILPNGEQSSEPCYDTIADGATACAKTIQNGRYSTLLAGLQNSDTATFFSPAGMNELTIWSGGSTSYGPRLQNDYQNLPAPPSWAIGTIITPPVVTPVATPPPSLLGWLGAGLTLLGIGGLIALAATRVYAKPATAYAHYKPHTDTTANMTARMRPEYTSFLAEKPTAAQEAEVTAPPDACTAYNRIKAALIARGTRVTEPRNLEPGIEAYYDPDANNIMISPGIAAGCDTCSPHCDAYSTQVLVHEGAHELLHNPDCLPKFREGMTYTSSGHIVEEAEADLSAMVTMVNLGLPVQLYDGSVVPPGSVEADWALAKRVLDKETYENVRWASNWLTQAAQGGMDASLSSARCPLYNP